MKIIMIMQAASAGHCTVARILLEFGAGINTHSNEFKESALTLACYKGHLEMVRFLLEAGADQEHKTDEMHTALMEASMDGHVEVARLLLDSGAQVKYSLSNLLDKIIIIDYITPHKVMDSFNSENLGQHAS